MKTGNVITGGEESSDAKDDVSKPADIPLHLMAVSRHIVSEVIENAIRCFEQLIHPTIKPEMRGENISETPEIPLQLMAVSRHIVSGVQENSIRSYEQSNSVSLKAEKMGENISDATEMPLQLMAVSHDIVSEVQESSIRSLEQSNHHGIKEERVNINVDTHDTPPQLITSHHTEVPVLQSCEERNHVRTKRHSLALPREASLDCMERQHAPMGFGDISAVAMEVPVMIDSEAGQDYDNVVSLVVEMETSIPEERRLDSIKHASTRNKKPSSRLEKTARNKMPPGGKKLQMIPRAPASKKPNARKQASHSLLGHRSRSARKGACNLLLACQPSTAYR